MTHIGIGSVWCISKDYLAALSKSYLPKLNNAIIIVAKFLLVAMFIPSWLSTRWRSVHRLVGPINGIIWCLAIYYSQCTRSREVY